MVSADVYKPNLNTLASVCNAVAARAATTTIISEPYLNAIYRTGFVYPGDLYSVNAFCLCSQSAYLHTADVTPNFMEYRSHAQTNDS